MMLTAFKHHGLERYREESTLADKGYIGLGLAILARGKKARRAPADVKAVNRFISSRPGGSGAGDCLGEGPGVLCARVSGGRWVGICGCFRWWLPPYE